MQNLRDKLLKAGLVSEDQAKKAETSAPAPRRPPPVQPQRAEGGPQRRDERPPRRDDRPPRREDRPPRRDDERPPRRDASRPPQGRPAPTAAAAAERPIPKLPPMPGSKAYQRIESKKQAELDKALRELVQGAQVPSETGETTFYFMTRKGKLRRMELSPSQAKQLEDGVLAVVERPEPAQIEHSLVPAATAEQMFALSKKSVRFLNRKESPIGFMSDEDVKTQQAAEAAGTAPEIPDEPEAGEEAAEGAASPAEESPEAGNGPSEPQAQ
ncbi:hypothetical protein SAMN05444354_101257 [Stigmatella aurantiaca]|uniref:DUF2058 family protein n=1 Tax=Stigmatella aurantiaca TaxID=41 RepID=A0A1H7FZG3_STIAU|nr:DUF2058 family protein [Stigmatella aurantiaca]SEK31298.1 hypothetical protein SAMN05444354_101257 [Stigmatella aurantiaca]